MVATIELIFLIVVLFGAQRYLSSLEQGWLGLVPPVIFTIYMFIKLYYLNEEIEYFWYKLASVNFVLLTDYYLGQEKKKVRHKKELEKMKSKDI
ncbi:hypothetical protein [Macrococcus animalis]|uniref:hypothetical protein n=1 Tax=Macrococcus animalis TaxID=3395467 RepID=UPI0039BEDC62